MFHRLVSHRTLKWTGTATCTLVASLFVASLWISAKGGFRVGTYLILVGAFEGHVAFNLTDGSMVGDPARLCDAMATEIRFRSSPVITWWSPLVESPPRPTPNLCIVVLSLWLPLLIL